MSRLINADALIEQIKNPYTEYPVMIKIRKAIEDMINEVPTVDAEPVRHGRWNIEYETEDGKQIRCSECKMVYWVGKGRDGNYCPNCGAKMDEEEKDCERCLQVTERPGNDICKACGGRRGQDATRVEESDLRDLRE